jgi:hypothetical protein
VFSNPPCKPTPVVKAPLRVLCARSALEWTELPPLGVYCLSISEDGRASEVELHPWDSALLPFVPSPDCALARVELSVTPLTSVPQAPQHILDVLAAELLARLSNAVRVRVTSIPPAPVSTLATGSLPPARIAVLFSGGLDCMVIAALSHRFVPAGEPIDLINVSFDPLKLSPDRVTGLAGLVELQRVFPER